MRSEWLAIPLTLLSLAAGQESPDAGGQSQSADQPREGTVCVLPNSPNPPTRISPGGEYNPATLTLRIDKQKPILWPHKQLIKIEHLALNDPHIVVLTSDGKRIKSFWLRFSDWKEAKLCIYFDGYQGVQVGDKQSALWCKCR